MGDYTFADSSKDSRIEPEPSRDFLDQSECKEEAAKAQPEPAQGGSGKPPRITKTAQGYSDEEETPRVQVLDSDHVEIGRMTIREAFQLARSMGLTLDVIRGNVVRICDPQKLRDQPKERNRLTKEKHGVRDIVEVKLRFNVDEDGYQKAFCKAQVFLLKGDNA